MRIAVTVLALLMLSACNQNVKNDNKVPPKPAPVMSQPTFFDDTTPFYRAHRGCYKRLGDAQMRGVMYTLYRFKKLGPKATAREMSKYTRSTAKRREIRRFVYRMHRHRVQNMSQVMDVEYRDCLRGYGVRANRAVLKKCYRIISLDMVTLEYTMAAFINRPIMKERTANRMLSMIARSKLPERNKVALRALVLNTNKQNAFTLRNRIGEQFAMCAMMVR